jgi:Fe-S-cluster containining protein
MLKVIQDDVPWYADGLRFECTGCGKCCTGAPGYIWVDDAEITQIADYLQMTTKKFCKKFVRIVKGRQSLLELPKSYDCIFLKDKKCQIYPVRPKQCRTFPWWVQHLKSEADWKKAALTCEGIKNEAPLIPFDEIEQQRSIQEQIFPHDS